MPVDSNALSVVGGSPSATTIVHHGRTQPTQQDEREHGGHRPAAAEGSTMHRAVALRAGAVDLGAQDAHEAQVAVQLPVVEAVTRRRTGRGS